MEARTIVIVDGLAETIQAIGTPDPGDEETDPLEIMEKAVAAQIENLPDPSEEETDPDRRATIDEIVESVEDALDLIPDDDQADDDQAEQDRRKQALVDRLHDPEKILDRLQCRLSAERVKAAGIMENQELDEEERTERMDESLTKMGELEQRIAHQRLMVAFPEKEG